MCLQKITSENILAEHFWYILFNPFSYIYDKSAAEDIENVYSKIWTISVIVGIIIENIAAKGEIACFEQFLLLS